MNCGALRKGHLTMAVAPKHGRLEEAEQHHQSHAILECMFMIPEVFDLLDELVDERNTRAANQEASNGVPGCVISIASRATNPQTSSRQSSGQARDGTSISNLPSSRVCCRRT